MMNTQRQALFDRWAAKYDSSVANAAGSFPFDGYERVLATVVEAADAKSSMTVLDIGTGTGQLAELFLAHACVVWGVDFSAEMLAQSRTRLPQIQFVQADLLAEAWPMLPAQFDCIVSTYVFHEFNLRTKVAILQRLVKQHLAPGGRLVIGDIAFPTVAGRSAAASRWVAEWDEDEFYWAADESVSAFQSAGLAFEYRQLSSCAGVFSLSPAASALFSKR